MTKFKVGDKARVRAASELVGVPAVSGSCLYRPGGHRREAGKIITINNCYPDKYDSVFYTAKDNECKWWPEQWLEIP